MIVKVGSIPNSLFLQANIRVPMFERIRVREETKAGARHHTKEESLDEEEENRQHIREEETDSSRRSTRTSRRGEAQTGR